MITKKCKKCIITLWPDLDVTRHPITFILGDEMSASWTQGVIAQSVRASESISVVSSRGFKSHSGLLSMNTFENPSMVNTICIDSFCY